MYYWRLPTFVPNLPQAKSPFFGTLQEGAMSKFSRTWQLVKQSFVILRSDKQLMLFPILSAISCLFVTAMIATGGTLLIMPSIASAAASGERFQPNHSPMFLIGM